ncbi:MAG: tripartite tricarboxylate transporter TctB family protein [Angelakisella sp.]|nr:tripartite tricarboxylate transporter TctB family protein [Angelakisella sp.]
MKFGSKQIIPLLTAAFALVFIYTGLSKFGFWDEIKGPTPGFVPTIISVILLGISVLAFLQSFKDKKPSYPKENFLVILAGIGIFAFTFLIGMIPTIIIYVILWLKLVEKTPWKQTLIVLAVIMAIVLGVFVFWLGVPFPEGIIFEALLG